MKDVSIVILNWNGRTMLERFLPSVIDSLTERCRLVVADNASTDSSVALLNECFPEVEIVRFSKNHGFAEGYNRALSEIDTPYYILLNSDVETPRGWIEPLLNYMEQHPECAACQPKLHSWHNKEMFEYAGAAGGFLDKYGYPFCRGRIFNKIEKDLGQYDDDVPLLWATGACLCIRREDYLKAGGFDSNFFAHNEEIDLCWRLRLMGRQIRCVSASTVYHVGGGTLPQGNPRKTFLNFRNNLAMLYKNLPDSDLTSVMRIRCILDYVAAFKSLILDHSLGDFHAIIKARREFKTWIPRLKKQREEVQNMAVEKIIPERKSYCILISKK